MATTTLRPASAILAEYRTLRDALELRGMTPPGYAILHALLDAGRPLTMGELCERTGAACSTMTDAVDRLERRGWVRRQRDTHDRRVVYLVLADEASARALVGNFG